jgi:hypothetical protein
MTTRVLSYPWGRLRFFAALTGPRPHVLVSVFYNAFEVTSNLEAAFISTSFAARATIPAAVLSSSICSLLVLHIVSFTPISTGAFPMSSISEPPTADTMAAPIQPDLSDGQCIVCGNRMSHKCTEDKGFSWCYKSSYLLSQRLQIGHSNC